MVSGGDGSELMAAAALVLTPVFVFRGVAILRFSVELPAEEKRAGIR